MRPSRTDRNSAARRGGRITPEHQGRDARTVLKVGQDFYILASSLASRRATRVLADGRSFAVFEVGGDILDAPSEALGLFHRDTRYLSRFELRIAHEAPYLLNSYLSDDNALLRVNLTNPDLGVQRGAIELRRDAIQIERSWVLREPTMLQRLIVRNFARTPVRLPIEFTFAVDFADLFQVRGVKRRRRGEAEKPEVNANHIRFGYQGLDGVRRTTEIMFKPEPRSLGDDRASYVLNLKPDERVVIEARISVASDSPRELPPPRSRISRFDEALESRRAEIARLGEGCARISASNEYLESLLRHSAADLLSIVSRRPEGVHMMAGIPWFATLFGRDSIVTALATLPFCPELAGGTLRTLAAMQGVEVNERRDEQPGKIIHEVRSGEMAATGEVPFGRYYGSIDSTPLFLWLYGRYTASTGDLALADELWPKALRAIEWIEKWGDRDGDGYIEYVRESARGLANQGWKDSVDAISHADGGLARAPIALCEVQGYVYGAYKMAAQVADRLNHNDEASRMRERASALRDNFLRDFWLEKEGTVALALDADKRPCRVMASNAAHCLASGLLNQEQAEILARRLMADDMFSGWGVRTLSANERRYNPMSYHNGSVWPHDNAIAAVGLARLEGREGVLRILDGLLDAAVQLKAGSLPELFCGFAREPRLGPAPYPVACHPQAWAAASIFMILQAMLGLRVMALERRLVIDSPVMPPWLEWLRIEDLSVGKAKVSLVMRRTPISAAVEVTEKRGQVVVEVRK